MDWREYYCSIIIVSLFSSFVPSLASDGKRSQKLWHVVQKTETFAPSQKSLKITRSYFLSKFFDSMLHTIGYLPSVLSFFDLSCRSAPKKLLTTRWSVFHRICHILCFLSFANLKLAFSLQKVFGNLEKQ